MNKFVSCYNFTLIDLAKTTYISIIYSGCHDKSITQRVTRKKYLIQNEASPYDKCQHLKFNHVFKLGHFPHMWSVFDGIGPVIQTGNDNNR